MIHTLFWSRLREGMDEATLGQYQEDLARLRAMGEKMPGFHSIKSYACEDGDRLTVVSFETPEAQAAWRNQPDHAAIQAKGREAYYETYTSVVCEELRAVTWAREPETS